jgi:hypothetical protein
MTVVETCCPFARGCWADLGVHLSLSRRRVTDRCLADEPAGARDEHRFSPTVLCKRALLVQPPVCGPTLRVAFVARGGQAGCPASPTTAPFILCGAGHGMRGSATSIAASQCS